MFQPGTFILYCMTVAWWLRGRSLVLWKRFCGTRVARNSRRRAITATSEDLGVYGAGSERPGSEQPVGDFESP